MVADGGVGEVEAAADTPLHGIFGEDFAGAADEQFGVFAAEGTVARVRWVDDIVAVYAHAREEGNARVAAQIRECGQGPAAVGDELAQVGGELAFDAGGGGMDEGGRGRIEGVAVGAEDFADFGLVEIDLVVAGAPPQRAAGAGVAVDDLGLEVGGGDVGVGGEDPAVVGEDDRRRAAVSGVRGVSPWVMQAWKCCNSRTKGLAQATAGCWVIASPSASRVWISRVERMPREKPVGYCSNTRRSSPQISRVSLKSRTSLSSTQVAAQRAPPG